MTEAWLMAATLEDQRLENRREPNVPVTLEELADIGVFYRKMNVETMLAPGDDGAPSELDRFMAANGYQQRDEVCCSPAALENYETRLKAFFTEHIHEDDEIRLVKAGSGYFDVRNAADEWVRIRVTPGDLLVIPAGIYHRFTMDTADFTHAIRLFSSAPKWTPINRPCEESSARQQWLRDFVTNPHPGHTAVGDADGARNILIKHPPRFDETVRAAVRALDAARRDLAVIYFTGTPSPKTGASWCPDCVAADPHVRAGVEALRAAAAGEGRIVTFIQATVERGSYLKNPAYLYRVHPFITLKSIPTLMVLEASATEEEGSGVATRLNTDNVEAGWEKAFM